MHQAPDQLTPLSPKGMGAMHSGRQSSFVPSNINSMNGISSASRVLSPPPTPRSPMLRPDRLSLRLKSNSGMALHTNDNALSQYTDYNCFGRSPSAFDAISPGLPSPPTDDRFAYSGRSASPFSRDVPNNPGAFTGCLPYMDFLGRDVFQMALDSPAVMRQLLHYCEKQGCEENVEFLIKIREYAQATNDMTVALTNISTQYTSLGAAKPVMFPSHVSRSLNSDIKRIAHATIPGLEAVFSDARAHIENRLATDVFPGFVKNQLVQCTVNALETGMAGASSSQLEYPGLGTSFCMTDAMGAENAIVSVSDHFVSLTGHARAEIVGQNCSLLQGPFTDIEAMRRMRVSVREGREAVELVLNFRKNGEAFWNLLFLLPLKDVHRGQIQYWLGAQVNVSENLDSRKDLLRALNAGAALSSEPVDNSSSADERASTENASPPTTQERGRRNSSVRTSTSGQGKSRRLFDSFRRRAASTTAAAAPSPPLFDPSEPIPGQQKMPKNSRFAAQRYQPRAQVHVYPTAYSHYMVLRYVASDPSSSPGCTSGMSGSHPNNVATPASVLGSSTSSAASSSTSGSAPSPSLGSGKSAKRNSAKLLVAYYNKAAVDLLSIRGDVTGADIFQVLADKARSPTVTRSFKSNVRERLVDGLSTTTKMVLDRSSSGSGRPGLLSKRRRSSTAGAAARTSTSTSPRQSMQQLIGQQSGDQPRQSESSEAMMMAAAAAAEKKAHASGKTPKNDSLYSHWVPLKNAMGVTEWVVLLLTPIPSS
ncbi:Blue-light-activated histidine kinase 1 [Apiospora arundinis]|uniref:Blue-light-activated histidine kinase 1 n=1 Tax=Apiospora arundinis TaxID=335852 RepID=A0ABR2ITZ0_9PEZI